MAKKTTSFRLEPSVHQELKILSAQLRVPIGEIIAQGVALLKADLKWKQDIIEACRTNIICHVGGRIISKERI
jgi:hypothetical protein